MIDLGYVNGKRKRKMLSGKTRKEVAEKLKAAQAALQRGENLAPVRQTMQHFLDGWLEEVIKPNVKAKTHESYSQMVRLYIVPHIGGRQLANLAPGHVQNMLNALRESGRGDGSGLSPRTVQYVRAVLRQALELAVDRLSMGSCHDDMNHPLNK